MKRSDLHSELTLIGVNSVEVHLLVDDLDLDFGPIPLWFRFLLKSHVVDIPPKNVYSPHTIRKEVCGRIF